MGGGERVWEKVLFATGNANSAVMHILNIFSRSYIIFCLAEYSRTTRYSYVVQPVLSARAAIFSALFGDDARR